VAHAGKRMDVVKKLVEAGADVNKLGAITKEVCDLGYMHPLTPLMIACIQDSSDCVQMLLDARADATLIDAQGHNALHYAAKHGAKLCVDKLLAHGNAAAAQVVSSRARSANICIHVEGVSRNDEFHTGQREREREREFAERWMSY
jgi:hypothetical protein